MTPATLIAALAGGLVAAGTACVTGFFTLPARPVAAPPPRWRGLLARWRITPRMGLAAVGVGLVVLAVTGWPVAGLAAVPATVAIPRVLSRRPARTRIAKLEALEVWTRRLAEEQALRAFADAIDDPVGDLIATALLLAADRRGPGVHAVLTELAADVAKDVAAWREVEAERATYRTTLVWIVVFLLGYTAYLVLRRSYSAPFGTPLGQVVLAAVAACYAAGLYWLHRLSLTTGPQRFLRRDHGPVRAQPAPAAWQRESR